MSSTGKSELRYCIRKALYYEKTNNLPKLAETKIRIEEIRARLEEDRKWAG